MTTETMMEGQRLAIAAMDCSGLRRAVREYVDGIAEFVAWQRKTGVPLYRLPDDMRRQVKAWRRWLRHRQQWEAMILSELIEVCEGDEPGASED
jgi:hypothetical protein